MTTNNKVLTARAMLVNLKIKKWSARKEDKQVSKDVASQYHTTLEAGKYNKALISKESIKKIQKAANEARTYHYTHTLPWDDDGPRILTAAEFDNYNKEMRKQAQEFKGLVSDFLRDYDQFVAEAQQRLNGMFNPDDYPTTAEIHKKFSFAYVVAPLPSDDDFRVNLQADDVDRIQQEISERLQAAEQTALNDLWNRLHDVTLAMANKLSDIDMPSKGNSGAGNSPKKTFFKDSLVGNITDLCDLLPRLNMSHDTKLDAMGKEIADRLTKHSPDTLRKDSTARKAMAADARKLAKDIESGRNNNNDNDTDNRRAQLDAVTDKFAGYGRKGI